MIKGRNDLSQTDNNLVERVKNKARKEDDYNLYPKVSALAIKKVETELGFLLPDLLKTLYIEVGNGGFGPFDGIIGINDEGWAFNSGEGETLVQAYKGSFSMFPFFKSWHWPEKLLPICEDGYGLFCLDCNEVEVPVIYFELDSSTTKNYQWKYSFSQVSPSLENWLEDWVNKLDQKK